MLLEISIKSILDSFNMAALVLTRWVLGKLTRVRRLRFSRLFFFQRPRGASVVVLTASSCSLATIVVALGEKFVSPSLSFVLSFKETCPTPTTTSCTGRNTPRAAGLRARSAKTASLKTRCGWPSWCRWDLGLLHSSVMSGSLLSCWLLNDVYLLIKSLKGL